MSLRLIAAQFAFAELAAIGRHNYTVATSLPAISAWGIPVPLRFRFSFAVLFIPSSIGISQV